MSRPWGGSRAQEFVDLADVERRDDQPIGEWWLLSCQEPVSRVRSGPFAGRRLDALVEEFGAQILGERHADAWLQRFPVLIKVLDAAVPLSVQVHPAESDQPGHGKTESWFVLEAAPQALLYAGLREGSTAEDMLADAERGTSPVPHLEARTPVPDMVAHIPAGTVHALGGGLVIIEVQETSDTTFRIYAWDREPRRELHLDEARRVLRRPARPEYPEAVCEQREPFRRERLVDCSSYRMEMWHLEPVQEWRPRSGTCSVLIPLDEGVKILHDEGEFSAPRGHAMLVPALGTRYQIAAPAAARLLWVRPGPA